MLDKKQYISQTNDHGSILISEDVVSTIAYRVVSETEGFGGFTTRNNAGFAVPLNQKNWHKGIRVIINEKGQLFLEINALVLYGSNILTFAQNIQQTVTDVVSSTIGRTPKCVHVNINGIVRK